MLSGARGPYSVLLIIGEGGAAKTTLAKLIVALVDPRLLPLLNAPKSKRDLYIAASTRALVAYNNLSYLDKDYIGRSLYRDRGWRGQSARRFTPMTMSSSIHAKAPFILVAIDNVVTRGDLASRTLKTELAAFPPESSGLPILSSGRSLKRRLQSFLARCCSALSVGLRRYDSLDQKGSSAHGELSPSL